MKWEKPQYKKIPKEKTINFWETKMYDWFEKTSEWFKPLKIVWDNIVPILKDIEEKISETI